VLSYFTKVLLSNSLQMLATEKIMINGILSLQNSTSSLLLRLKLVGGENVF